MNYRKGSQIGLLTALLLGGVSFMNPEWQSKYLKVTNGKLTYIPDDKGNIIPDFSRVGYHQGEMEIPDVKIVKTVTAPIEGSSQEMIQQAIDEIAQLPPDQNGFRGTLLLKKGTYRIPGFISIKTGGIVLKGEGDDENGTVVIASGKGQRSLFKISGKSSAHEIKETKVIITDSYVPVGSFSFQVEDGKGLQVGNLIWMVRPGTENWIHDLKMDQIDERVGTKQWKTSDYDLKFERVITRIEGNRIYIDQPVVMAMDQKYGGGYITQITDSRIAENGIENILFKSEYLSETDEDHGWYAISFQHIQNGWVRKVTSKYFGNGCVTMEGGSKYVTVIDSKCLDAKSQITGGRRYSFNIGGQFCLVRNCETTEGRHDFVTGSKVLGPNVFTNCKARNTHADIGPHHRWSCGTLYNLIDTDGEINVQDRGNWGSGHGWAGANQVIWNCKAARAAVQNPWVSAKNWCVGLIGTKSNGRLEGRPDGEWEGFNQPGLIPNSLYEAQKTNRK